MATVSFYPLNRQTEQLLSQRVIQRQNVEINAYMKVIDKEFLPILCIWIELDVIKAREGPVLDVVGGTGVDDI